MPPVAILAGGLATRLHPITATIPKALVEVAGKPFVIRQLNYLRTQGISRVVLCVGHLGARIREVVGRGESLGMTVSYSEDGSKLLGTGGALKKATHLLGDKFFVLYGDSFLPVNFSVVHDAFERSNKPALMTILENKNRWDKSNVHYLDGTIREYNKHNPREEMTYIDYGLAIMKAEVMQSNLFGQSFDLGDVYHTLSLRGNLAGLEVQNRFFEIGSHLGLKDAEQYFLTTENE